MALVHFRSRDMDASVPAAAEAPSLLAQARFLFDTIGLAALGYVGRVSWRASARVTAIEDAQATQEKLNAKIEAAIAAQRDAHVALLGAVAERPTRDEMRDMFGEVREDIRELRRAG
jgi:hypothetical protein